MRLTNEQLQTYLKGIAKERNFDDARTGRLVQLVTGEGDITLTRAEIRELLEPIVEHPLARHSEFSSRMDAVTQKYAALEKWRTEVAEPAVARADQEKAQLQRTVDAFRARFGELEDVEDIGGGRGKTATGEVVDMAKVNALIDADRKARSHEFLAFQMDQDRITREHYDRFKTLPDISELIRIIGAAANDPIKPRTMSLDEAYKEKYGDQVQKHEKDAEERRFQEEVDKRDRARRARKSDSTGTNADGVFWSHHKDQPAATAASGGEGGDKAPANDADLANNFMSTFNQVLRESEASGAQSSTS